MKPLLLEVGDLLTVKKPHPCGSSLFLVLRTGADVKLRCRGCGREMMLPREKAERAIKLITSPRSTTDPSS